MGERSGYLDGVRGLARIALRRQADHLRMRVRGSARGALGFTLLASPQGRVTIVEGRVSAKPKPVLERRMPAGVIAGRTTADHSSAIAHAAAHYGIEARIFPMPRALEVFHTATHEAWPVLSVSLEGVAELPMGVALAMHTYLLKGGTAMVGGITPQTNALAAELTGAIDLRIPLVEALDVPAAALHFSGSRADFCFELAGSRMEIGGLEYAFNSGGAGEIGAVESGSGLRSVVVEREVGLGRLLLVAGPDSIEGPFGESLAVAGGIRSLAALMVLRRDYGDTSWTAPFRFANFTIDDPALRNDFVGLDYKRALGIAEESNFHLTVATIPYELRWAQARVVELLRQRPDRLSACYHGYRHDGYEFYLPEAVGTKWRQRPLAEQFDALARSAREGVRLAEGNPGYALDRVMVFPHGIGPVPILAELGRLGFIATCNASDRLPLGAALPAPDETGLRPSGVSWGGFPTIWRRAISDVRTFALDLFLGRPAIAFSHRRALGGDMAQFRDRAETINRLGGNSVRWTGLETIAKHAFLQRRLSSEVWEAMMLGNDIELRNPDTVPRDYLVRRDHLPADAKLAATVSAGGLIDEGSRGLATVKVSLPPQGAARIRVRLKDMSELPEFEAQRAPVSDIAITDS